MRWWSPLLLCGILLLLPACSPLENDSEPQNLVPLSELPADYGELVTVLHYPGGDTTPLWDELWFENEDTGTITRVPVYRVDWAYAPDRIRQIKRSTAAGG